MAKEQTAHELSRSAFEDGLNTLRSGHIPANMSNIVCHIKDTTKELMEYAEAMTECVFRQERQIKLQQSIINAGKKAGVIASGNTIKKAENRRNKEAIT